MTRMGYGKVWDVRVSKWSRFRWRLRFLAINYVKMTRRGLYSQRSSQGIWPIYTVVWFFHILFFIRFFHILCHTKNTIFYYWKKKNNDCCRQPFERTKMLCFMQNLIKYKKRIDWTKDKSLWIYNQYVFLMCISKSWSSNDLEIET